MKNACVAIWEKGVPEDQHAQRSFVQDCGVVKRPQGWREMNEAETRQAEARSCRGLGAIVKSVEFVSQHNGSHWRTLGVGVVTWYNSYLKESTIQYDREKGSLDSTVR